MSESYVEIMELVFSGKNILWDDVETYLEAVRGETFVVKQTGDQLRVGSKFPSEYCGSHYSKRLRGGTLKGKS